MISLFQTFVFTPDNAKSEGEIYQQSETIVI